MVTVQGLLTFSCLLLAEVMLCHGFWYFSSSSSNNAKKMGGPPPGYSVRSEAPYGAWPPGPPAPYQADSTGQHLTVALPVAVPFQPQMGPPPQALQGRLHDVQLVPCLCPVSTLMAKDYDQQQTQAMPQQPGYQQMQQMQMQHQQSATANNP